MIPLEVELILIIFLLEGIMIGQLVQNRKLKQRVKELEIEDDLGDGSGNNISKITRIKTKAQAIANTKPCQVKPQTPNIVTTAIVQATHKARIKAQSGIRDTSHLIRTIINFRRRYGNHELIVE
ncbi:MAG: hypothetical protein ISS58_08950 [Dehalococcoidales bacterium]|nr:hypothetical protein [Dehalococcoidales bacterium]